MSRSSSNKDMDLTLSYTLSDEENTLRSKRIHKEKDNSLSTTNKITETEDFQKFYKEMNLKLFSYK